MAEKKRFKQESNDSRPARIYSFGALVPSAEDRELINGIMRQANEYFNALVKNRVEHQERYEARRREESPEYVTRCAEVDSALATRRALSPLILEARRGLPKASNPTPEPVGSQVEAANAALKEAQVAKRKARLAVDATPTMREFREEINLGEREGLKALRRACTLYSGTKELAEEEFLQAVASCGKAKRPLHTHEFDGSGRVGMRFQGGLCIAGYEDIQAPNIQMEPVIRAVSGHNRARHLARCGDLYVRARGAQFANVTFRVAASPVQSVLLRVKLHRPLPRAASLRRAWILARKVAGTIVYSLQLSIRGSFDAKPCGKKLGAINFGWRWRADKSQLLVATLMDSDGAVRPIELSAQIVRKFDFADSLHGIRQMLANDARDRIVTNVASAALPENFGKETGIAKIVKVAYEAADNSAELWEEWRKLRLENGLDLHDWDASARFARQHKRDPFRFGIACWIRKNRHLYHYEQRNRRRAENMRRDLYRKIAYELAGQYHTILHDGVVLTSLSKNESDERQSRATKDFLHRQKNRACVHLLRQFVKETLGDERFMKVPIKHPTSGCFVCGAITKVPDPQEKIWTCPKGHIWDQDENHCRNLLVSSDLGGEHLRDGLRAVALDAAAK